MAKLNDHRMARYSNFSHLPTQLQSVSEPFHHLFWQILDMDLHDEAERTAAIRKLREAKDCVVGAALPLGQGE